MAEARHGPLAGVRILELETSHTVPLTGMLLADLGCDVVRVRRSGTDGGTVVPLLYRGRSEMTLDLADAKGRDAAMALIARADGLIEGFAPGAAESMGLGPEPCLSRNPRLVYGRMSGWGREGPLAGRSGNDINHLALVGALHAIGPAELPVPPLGLVGEFSGAMLLALGMVSAILASQATGQGQVVDVAQIDGAATMMTLYYALFGAGRWMDARASNLTDGAAPFYRCYVCADGRHVAVGALDPGEFTALCLGLGLRAQQFRQYDRQGWPEMAATFAHTFARRTRDEWARHFEGLDASVTPVLSLAEAPAHPHNRAHGTFGTPLGPLQPMPAPRFSATPLEAMPQEASTVAEVLERWG